MSRMRFRLFSQSAVSGNELIGKIPPEIGNLTTLLELYIGYYNAFEDGLPPEIGNLSALVRFDAANCGLTGEIPPEIGKLQNLVSVHSIAAGKKVILFGVPGALTPTCSMNHVPGFIEKAEELKSKGVDEIICFSVNDPFVMKAWGKTYPENKHVKFVADGSGEYTQLLGLELDLKAKGLGVRSRRFALLLDNLKVTVANVESGSEFTVSSAEDILKSARVYGEP